jgi:hypothetical protein
MRRLLAGLTTAIFLTAGISFAGTVTSYVTPSGNVQDTYHHLWGVFGDDDGWSGPSIGGDGDYSDAYYSYSWTCCPASGAQYTKYTWLQVALPAVSGNITSAMLYLDVWGSPGYFNNDGSGIYAVLNHTSNASSANGNASQELGGDQLVANLSPGGPGWLGVNVTSFIQSDYSGHYSWAAFEFVPGAAGSQFNSDFAFGAAQPPTVAGDPAYLLITTDAGNGPSVPEPATLSLAGLAVLAFGLVSRRRKI